MSTKTEDLAAYYKKKYPLTLNQGISPADQSLSKRYENAWEVAKTAAMILKENYKARKVVIFGSLTNRSSFTHWSDIDMAVWGLPDEMFYAAVGSITSLTSEFKIDLVDISECRASLRNTIEAEGLEI